MCTLENMILLGGIVNIGGGLLILIKPDIIRTLFNTDFDPFANPLIGRFAAGVIVAFGLGYVYTYLLSPQNLSVVALGTCVRFWMAILCAHYYLKKQFDRRLLTAVAAEALFFALIFLWYIYDMRGVLTWR